MSVRLGLGTETPEPGPRRARVEIGRGIAGGRNLGCRALVIKRVRNLARNTQLSRLQQVSALARHFQKSPQELEPEKMRAYQL